MPKSSTPFAGNKESGGVWILWGVLMNMIYTRIT